MIKKFANEICAFLQSIPEVKSCKLYGSLAEGIFDEYSDIDIEIDVSGEDNGIFLTRLPALFAKKYDIVFCDYAPSLAPEKYIVTIATNAENPFMIIDISCVATPHCDTVSKQDLMALNTRYDHTLKLFAANLKHYLRGFDYCEDIEKMYGRIFGRDTDVGDEEEMLHAVYTWLKDNAESQHEEYISRFEDFLM